jgi:hypothetical protein
MAKQNKREFVVYVRMNGEPKGWTYMLMARSAGHAVERILWHTGWLPAQYGDRFVTAVAEIPF